ncbi:hypothetical protein NQ318_011173 [Aromia moschata]|uniref:Uncharacterized protein n=1 Tax=Aromia moschata TaxID=1265417 RepID=A0AAV8YI19_9CUCU|nr:hypothetical protein NQ318_011173 [Aromia moschata]
MYLSHLYTLIPPTSTRPMKAHNIGTTNDRSSKAGQLPLPARTSLRPCRSIQWRLVELVCVYYVIMALDETNWPALGGFEILNGYNFKLNSVKSCHENSVVKAAPDFDVKVDQDCNLIFSGCVVISKPVKTAKGKLYHKEGTVSTNARRFGFLRDLNTNRNTTASRELKKFSV